MRARSVVAVLAVASLASLVTACGDDDEAEPDRELTAEEQPYADAWASTLNASGEGELDVPDDEATCMANAIMVQLGVQPFEDAGIEPTEINQDGETDDTPGEVLGDGVVSDGDANAILDKWETCADLPAILARSISAGLELDEDGEACVADGLSDGTVVRAGLLHSFTSSGDELPDDVIDDVLAIVEDCRGDSGQSLLSQTLAEGLAGEKVSAEQASCMADALIDDLGSDRLIELTAEGDFDAERQAEVGKAITDAAKSCDVPMADLGL